jgi:hypothetical protein
MAEFEKRLACVIKADGTIARGYMIDKCEFDGVNAYTITWKISLQKEAKTNFAGTIGSAQDEPVLPGLITVGLAKDPFQMRVLSYCMLPRSVKSDTDLQSFPDRHPKLRTKALGH